MGVHHKTGVVLTECIQVSWKPYLGPTQMVHMWNRHRRHRSHSRRYNCLDARAYGLLKRGGDYRLVHVVRDPLDVVISGYWYHLKTNDTHLVPGTGPGVLANLTLQAGLEHEARCMMDSVLPEMQEALRVTQNDSSVRLVSLEDFVDDFDGTAALAAEHLFGRGHPRKEGIARAARACDKARVEQEHPEHINSRRNYLEASESIRQSASPVWERVRALRA